MLLLLLLHEMTNATNLHHMEPVMGHGVMLGYVLGKGA
jgi:hypothetical protein